MSKKHDPRKQIRLWPKNEIKIRKWINETNLPISVTSMANMILWEGRWPNAKDIEVLHHAGKLE